MAILDKFEAQVFVDGIRAEEFNDDDEDAGVLPVVSQITKYVEAVSGAFFEFKFMAETSYKCTAEEALNFELFIDGEKMGGHLFMETHFTYATYHGLRAERSITGKSSNEATGLKLYKFQFADLETRDIDTTDDTSTFKSKYGDLGTFKIDVWRTKLLGKSTSIRTAQDTNIAPVPEKALKGRPLDVATRLTPVAYGGSDHSWRADKIGTKPLATFKFKYRTRRALQSLLILDRTPTPVPLEERPIEELTREEMTELITRQRERLPEVKTEGKLKRERSQTIATGRPLKSSKGNNGETIFHLDSDDDEEDDKDEIEELPAPKRNKVEVVDLS